MYMIMYNDYDTINLCFHLTFSFYSIKIFSNHILLKLTNLPLYLHCPTLYFSWWNPIHHRSMSHSFSHYDLHLRLLTSIVDFSLQPTIPTLSHPILFFFYIIFFFYLFFYFLIIKDKSKNNRTNKTMPCVINKKKIYKIKQITRLGIY